MNKAADYTTKLRWYRYVANPNTSNGQDEATYVANGYLRCGVEETNGRRQADDGATQTGAIATIRVRQYPAFYALDLLHDETFGYVWRTDSVSIGDNELLLDSYRNDTEQLEDFVILEDSE